MAVITPFRALRPTPAAVARVAAVPYDVVNSEEARALAAGNPLSFLHVSRAEIDLPGDLSPYSDAVYAKAAENFSRLIEQAPLVVEERPSLYVYRLRMGEHVQTGVAGTFSIDEYDRDIVKKHERTRRDKEDDRTRHIVELQAQTGPVFLTYRISSAVDSIVKRTTGEPALFDFVAPDGVQHTLWRVAEADTAALVGAFAAIPALYIADGHHRAASASRARRERQGGDVPAEASSFLAVAFPDTQVQVLPYNRIIRNLSSMSPDALLERLRQEFSVKDGPAVPARRGEVAMFLGGRWHTIVLNGSSPAADPADRLDVSRLQERILGPLLGIGDVRTDRRIDFVGGARGTSELEKLVQSGRAAVAFSMYPVGVDDLMAISDAGAIMPPKSTWFEPKLRDGLLIHTIGRRT